MDEGSLHYGTIYGDITKYTPSSAESAEVKGVIGGFPCQALWPCLGVEHKPKLVEWHFLSDILDVFCLSTKGVSQAGHMAGVEDSRSMLCSRIFDIADECPHLKLE